MAMRTGPARLAFASFALFLLLASPGYAKPKKSAAAEQLDLKIDTTESARLFSAAKKQWKAAFQPAQLRTVLEGIASGKTTIGPELKQQLYHARKSSAIVRSSFQLLDHKHYKPKALDTYVRAAGKLNDAINSGQLDKTPALARKALSVLKVAKIQAEVDAFVPSTSESFEGYLYTSMKFVRANKNAKKLKAPVYHQLRKEMTNMLVLFEPGRKLAPATQRLHDRLHKIRLEMGDVHDALIENRLKGGSYDAKKVRLTKSTQKDLRKVLQSLRISRPANQAVHYQRWRANVKSGRGAKRAAPVRVTAR
jgi:hypothetical protein